jgi:hypothetical protein
MSSGEEGRSRQLYRFRSALPANSRIVLSEAVLVIVIEVLGITRTERIEDDYEHGHENPNWRARPFRSQPGMCTNSSLMPSGSVKKTA